MSEIINVKLGERSYDITIEPGLLRKSGAVIASLVPSGSRFFIVTNTTVGPLYAQTLAEALSDHTSTMSVLTISDGEQYKNLTTMSDLYDELADRKARRSDMIIALGGGVVGDIAGFAAASWLRGLPFIQIPTTLLAQVDSSVGGKVGINHRAGKNLIGAFHQPRAVIIDPQTLTTLPDRELKAGMAEVIKYGCIKNPSLLSQVVANRDLISAVEPVFMSMIIAECCRIKAAIVEQDETETGLRTILNYGHTIGHAIEATLGYGVLLHGEAVMLGMRAAAWISVRMGLLSEAGLRTQVEAGAALGLRLTISQIDTQDILDHISSDKKTTGAARRFVLLSELGNPVINDEVTDELIIEAIENLKEEP